jgi:hypothetical protein
MNTVEAAQIYRKAFRRVFGVEPNDYELAFGLAQSHLESSWGKGWKEPCANSNNWGAVHSYKSDGKRCAYGEASPDGSYGAYMAVYDTPEDGAADFIKIAYARRLKVRKAAAQGDWHSAVVELYAPPRYFTGTACKIRGENRCLEIDHVENVRSYESAILARLYGPTKTIVADLGIKAPRTVKSSSNVSLIAIGAGLLLAGALALRNR